MIRCKINGRVWSVSHVPQRELGSGRDGDCDHPPGRHPRIRISDRLSGRARMETEIHEVLHASRPELDESAVQTTAREIATVLFRLGWRRLG